MSNNMYWKFIRPQEGQKKPLSFLGKGSFAFLRRLIINEWIEEERLGMKKVCLRNDHANTFSLLSAYLDEESLEVIFRQNTRKKAEKGIIFSGQNYYWIITSIKLMNFKL